MVLEFSDHLQSARVTGSSGVRAAGDSGVGPTRMVRGCGGGECGSMAWSTRARQGTGWCAGAKVRGTSLVQWQGARRGGVGGVVVSSRADGWALGL